MRMKTLFVCLCLSWVLLPSLSAAPVLRLIIPDTLRQLDGSVRPIWVATGTNGPTDLSFEAWNAGDGALNLQVSGGRSEWLAPSIGGAQPCSDGSGRNCVRIPVSFATSTLAQGTYEGAITVSDPSAADSPQEVPIKIHVGGAVPASVDLYVRPTAGNSDFVQFETGDHRQPVAAPTLVPNPAGQFLTVSSSGSGSFRFLHTHRITGTFRQGMAPGNFDGSVTLGGSAFAADNRAIPVTLHVTNGPIAALSAPRLAFSTAQDIEVAPLQVVLSNRGASALNLTGTTVETDSDDEWLSVESRPNNVFRVTAAVDGLEPGFYTGAVTFESNASNGSVQLPVSLEIQPQGPPEVAFRGVVNNADFDNTRPIAPGTIVALFGQQLAYDSELARDIPLPEELASTRVMIDGREAPLFFASYRQINFQVPYEVQPGTRIVQVIRDGQAGNQVTAPIAALSPGLIRVNVGEYGAIINASQGNNFPFPADVGQALGVNAAPARPGDTLTIFATGLGAVAPAVATGGPPPDREPFARANMIPLVNFGGRAFFGPFGTPSFVGLTPGFVGLFQINVPVPEGLAPNAHTPVNLEYVGGQRSNTVEIAVQR